MVLRRLPDGQVELHTISRGKQLSDGVFPDEDTVCRYLLRLLTAGYPAETITLADHRAGAARMQEKARRWLAEHQ